MSKNSSNVISILDKLHERDAFFPVERKRLFTEDGTEVHDRKAITRADTGNVLGVVSNTYKVVTNEDAMTSFVKALESIDVDLEGAEPLVDYSHDGAKTMVQLVIPSMVWDEPNGGGITAFRMLMKNSYDGSWKLEAFGGGLRGACMNGQVFGSYMTRYASRHVRNLSIQAAGDKIAMAFNLWDSNKELWGRMMRSKMTDPTAFGLLAAYVGQEKLAKEVLAVNRIPIEEEWPAGWRFMNAWKQWEVERKALGATHWALYNTLTHQSTRGADDSDSNRAGLIAAREEDVAKVIRLPAFEAGLAEAA